MEELPQSFRLIYGLTHLGLYPMVAHPFVSEVFITIVIRCEQVCARGVHIHKGVFYHKI